jgi:hypothetical protein
MALVASGEVVQRIAFADGNGDRPKGAGVSAAVFDLPIISCYDFLFNKVAILTLKSILLVHWCLEHVAPEDHQRAPWKSFPSPGGE